MASWVQVMIRNQLAYHLLYRTTTRYSFILHSIPYQQTFSTGNIDMIHTSDCIYNQIKPFRGKSSMMNNYQLSAGLNDYPAQNLSCKRDFSGPYKSWNIISDYTQKYGKLFFVFHTSCSVLSTAALYALITRWMNVLKVLPYLTTEHHSSGTFRIFSENFNSLFSWKFIFGQTFFKTHSIWQSPNISDDQWAMLPLPRCSIALLQWLKSQLIRNLSTIFLANSSGKINKKQQKL